MSWLVWIVFGLIAGAIAKIIMPGKDPGGFIVTILIGVAGAVVGGYLGGMFLGQGVDGFNIPSMAVAVGGSVLLLFLYRVVTKKK